MPSVYMLIQASQSRYRLGYKTLARLVSYSSTLRGNEVSKTGEPRSHCAQAPRCSRMTQHCSQGHCSPCCLPSKEQTASLTEHLQVKKAEKDNIKRTPPVQKGTQDLRLILTKIYLVFNYTTLCVVIA